VISSSDFDFRLEFKIAVGPFGRAPAAELVFGFGPPTQ
jgi:hypothetical protein